MKVYSAVIRSGTHTGVQENTDIIQYIERVTTHHFGYKRGIEEQTYSVSGAKVAEYRWWENLCVWGGRVGGV